MNENIKQLMIKANEYALDMNPEDFHGHVNFKNLRRARDAKFAELLVQVCARIADEPGGLKPGQRIRKCFGVE